MKYLFTSIIVIIFTQAVIAQDYMDEIAQKACECVGELGEISSSDNFNMQLGLCMIEAAGDYSDELLEEHGIDFKRIDEHGERLGELIGIKMASVCPAVLLEVAAKMEVKESESQSESSAEEMTFTTSGKITKVNENLFVEFTVRETNNKTRKYYWLSFVNSNIEMADNYSDLKGKKVTITYESQEFFDARIGEYRPFNIIVELEVE